MIATLTLAALALSLALTLSEDERADLEYLSENGRHADWLALALLEIADAEDRT